MYHHELCWYWYWYWSVAGSSVDGCGGGGSDGGGGGRLSSKSEKEEESCLDYIGKGDKRESEKERYSMRAPQQVTLSPF
uniref:Uncharacterized protein n=1 Tax=Vespula pensylvanica TaxID=30213 RepID=A0A834KQW3_VESPE|nr:hypothetical protein H0235_013497 [Vespula pensylvanica]